jgi:HSP20 family protein
VAQDGAGQAFHFGSLRTTVAAIVPIARAFALSEGGYALNVSRRRDLGRLQEEIEELFSDLWQVPRFTGVRRAFRPAVDCYRTDDPATLTVVIELPGVDAEAVDVAVADRALVVTGERRRPDSMRGKVFQQIEIEYGPFERHVPLGVDLDAGAARASFERGVLTIVLPIAQRSAGRVQVQVEIRRQT